MIACGAGNLERQRRIVRRSAGNAKVYGTSSFKVDQVVTEESAMSDALRRTPSLLPRPAMYSPRNDLFEKLPGVPSRRRIDRGRRQVHHRKEHAVAVRRARYVAYGGHRPEPVE